MNHRDRLQAAKELRRAVISAVVAELPPASQAEIGAAVAASRWVCSRLSRAAARLTANRFRYHGVDPRPFETGDAARFYPSAQNPLSAMIGSLMADEGAVIPPWLEAQARDGGAGP